MLEAIDPPEAALFLEPRQQFDKAIVGTGRRFSDEFIVYSEPDVIGILAADAEEDDEDPETSAREHFEYNIVGGWVGEGTPAFVTLLPARKGPPPVLAVRVDGDPIPQGSKKVWLGADGKPRMAEDAGIRHGTWRREVSASIGTAMATAGITEPLLTALALRVVFYRVRPEAAYGTGRNAQLVKPSAIPYPIARPDLDKLVRSILDSGTDARLWVDDSQVVSMSVHKRWTDRFTGRPAGVAILVSEL